MKMQELNELIAHLNDNLDVIKKMTIKVVERNRVQKIKCDTFFDTKKASLDIRYRPAWNVFSTDYNGKNWQAILVSDGKLILMIDGIYKYDLCKDHIGTMSQISIADLNILVLDLIPSIKSCLANTLAPEGGDWESKFPDAQEPDAKTIYEIYKFCQESTMTTS